MTDHPTPWWVHERDDGDTIVVSIRCPPTKPGAHHDTVLVGGEHDRDKFNHIVAYVNAIDEIAGKTIGMGASVESVVQFFKAYDELNSGTAYTLHEIRKMLTAAGLDASDLVKAVEGLIECTKIDRESYADWLKRRMPIQ